MQTNKKKFNLLTALFIGLFSFLASSPLYAWTNYFRFINNFNFPITMTINPTLAHVSNTCGGNAGNIEVNPRSASCELGFDAEQEHWYEDPKNQGTITLTKKSDPASYCVYNYNYTYTVIPYSYFDVHSEVITLSSCHGNLKPNEISVVNDHNKALPRPIAGNIILSIDKEAAAESTESFSQADCGVNSGDNCMIASPDIDTAYANNGSTLRDALRLQTQIDRFEPLNFAQVIGSHNSTISRHYTSSTNDYNLSYSDPDNYLSLTEQLNSGVRQIELDIEWYKNAITLCHNHESTALQGILCEGNNPMSSAINEIRSWIEKNPNEFIIVYLDVNLPLAGHINDLDSDLAKLEPYVFTPAMAKSTFAVTDNTLPAYRISKNSLLQQFKKNIIVTNDDDTDNTKSSRYVFVKVVNSDTTPLPEVGVDSMQSASATACNSPAKYDAIRTLYANDPAHYNMLRMNEYRTVMDYITDVNGREPSAIVDYYTTLNTYSIINCPINVFSTSMLGFTCDSNNCASHPTDPKLFSFLWSWDLGYPLKAGADIAYINPKTKHFANDALIAGNNYVVLCSKINTLNSPTAPLSWYLQTVKIVNSATAFDTATLTCQNSGGQFAAPTTSYWMNDVINNINAYDRDQSLVLVNYKNVNGTWTANVRSMQIDGQTISQGTSLVSG